MSDFDCLRDCKKEEESENSDDNLKIVLDTPTKRIPIPATQREKEIIESIEDELEKRLEEKVAKTNLNTFHVKNIIKHIVTNEHVLAMIRKLENPAEHDESGPVYEPKLTRSKAKELLSSSPELVTPIVPLAPVPWSNPKKSSETQVLLSGDLQDDSSGDEYIPNEEESEDDRDGSIFSDPPSVPPPTPPTPNQSDSVTQTVWSEDGMFKIPQLLGTEEQEDEATIARRTRSKLSLSATPLEVIEEAFIPPDITTDMYDMDCDNDDWMDFLKQFTRPLDEVAKPTEDEEYDPEYNILADEDIEEVDKEELRVDKAVKVSKKELNNLITELFEYATGEMLNNNNDDNKNEIEILENDTLTDNDLVNQSQNLEVPAKLDIDVTPLENAEPEVITVCEDKEEDDEVLFLPCYLSLLEQQLRQHVQMLTQNFILTYQHPEIHKYSSDMKEYLLNFKYLSEGKEKSLFNTVNLCGALQLISDWEKLWETNSEDVQDMSRHIVNTLTTSLQRKQASLPYVVTFPKLIFETISRSNVFLYPSLLPKIPFRSSQVAINKDFTASEDLLIALGLEQFMPYAEENKMPSEKKNTSLLTRACHFISKYMMPYRPTKNLFHRVYNTRSSRCAYNPIKYYFQHKEAPLVVHYVSSLDSLQVLPPCERLPEELPYQWKNYIYPAVNEIKSVEPIQETGIEANNLPIQSSVIHPDQIQPTLISSQPIEIQLIAAPFQIQSGSQCVTLLKGDPTIYPKHPNTVYEKKNTERRKRTYIKKVSPNTVYENKNTKGRKRTNINKVDPITKFVKCLSKPSPVFKLVNLFKDEYDRANLIDENKTVKQTEKQRVRKSPRLKKLINKSSDMPNLNTPMKNNMFEDTSHKSLGEHSSGANSEKKVHLDFSILTSPSFTHIGEITEVEFCKKDENSSSGGKVNVFCSQKLEPDPPKNNSSNATENPSNNVNDVNSQDKDNMETISALLAASSRIKPAVRKEPSGAEKKRAKIRREFLANLVVSAPEDPQEEKKKNEMFALQYYDKIRETLELEDYHKIMQVLNDYEEEDAVDLYKQVEVILRPKYEELVDEFLLFLREKEAAAVNKLVPWIRMNNRSKFLRKLEIYFKDQPSQLGKIYKCLTELSQTTNVSMEKIKSTLIPMFKGNQVLMDLFLQNFLDERPPPCLLEGPYETISISKELSRPDDQEIFETIIVPDVEDKYGNSSCICNCHEIEDPEFKSRHRHCIRCGTKFVNGKVYIQTGRGLRPASISFLTNPNIDHNIRLIGKDAKLSNQRKKRADVSPSKQVSLSPTKEPIEEDSDDEVDGKRKSKKKSPKRRKPQTRKSHKDPKDSQKASFSKKSNRLATSPSRTKKDLKSVYRKRSNSVKKSKDKKLKKTDSGKCEYDGEIEKNIKPGSSEGQIKRLMEDSVEWETEDNTTVSKDATEDIKPNSPEQQTAESESEFCEESSQDNCESDSNSSISSCNIQSQSDSNAGDEGSWTREEDKIILETFRRENDKETSFRLIADKLKSRSVSEIRNRFETLMRILMKTIGNDD